VLAVSPPGSAPSPRAELDPATLLERDSTRYTWGGHGFRLPEGGGRVPLAVRSERVALDLWGGPADGFSHNDRRALSAAAAILALELSRRRA